MKFSVIIPSRGRVRRLAAAITSLQMCESGENSIEYGVACDSDDAETQAFCANTAKEIRLAYRVGPRPQSLGGLDNDMAERMPADVYCVWGDDLLCLTPDWDKAIVEAVQKKPYGVFWWSAANGTPITVPIVTERWRIAARGIFTDYFPFWYDDLWLCEMWAMTTDEDLNFLDIRCLDKPTATIRMRDLAFWHEFYGFKRPERVAESQRIAKELGLTEPVMGPYLQEKLKSTLKMSPEVEEDIHRRNKAEFSLPPDPSYVFAKNRAQRMMSLEA